MANNAGHPSSDAGYSNIELDLDDIRDIDFITDRRRPATNTIDLTMGRMVTGPSTSEDGDRSINTRNGSSRQGGSRSAANQSSGLRIFGSDTDDEYADPLDLPVEPASASSSRSVAPEFETQHADGVFTPDFRQGSSLGRRRSRTAFGLAGVNERRRAVGLPELAEDTLQEEQDRDRIRNYRSYDTVEEAERRADGRRRRREAMQQAVDPASLPRSVRSAARERAEEAAARRRATPANPGTNAAQYERERRLIQSFHGEDPRIFPRPWPGPPGRPQHAWMVAAANANDLDPIAAPHLPPGPANNFATQEEHRDALEAVRISRELDRQEMADQRARAIADNARLRAEAPRNGIGAGGAGAWGMDQGGEEAALNDDARAAGFQGLGRFGGLAAYLPGPFGMDPFGPGGIGEGGQGRFFRGFNDIVQRNRGLYIAPTHGLPPSIEDAWKGCNYVGHREPPRSGYTFDFDRENNEAGAEPTDIIRLDTDEDAPWTQELSYRRTEKQHHKPHLVCARCQVPLRVSEGMRNEDDRVYALRCGHVVDARCLAEMSKPKALVIQPDEVLGGEDDLIGSRKDKVEDEVEAEAGPVEEDDEITKPSIRSKTRSSKRVVETKDDVQNGMNDIASTLTTATKRKRGGAASTTNGTGPSNATSSNKPAAPPARPKPPKKPPRGRWGKTSSAPEEYRWDCPVGEKCGRRYKSLKRGGQWMADPSAAVQLFV